MGGAGAARAGRLRQLHHAARPHRGEARSGRALHPRTARPHRQRRHQDGRHGVRSRLRGLLLGRCVLAGRHARLLLSHEPHDEPRGGYRRLGRRLPGEQLLHPASGERRVHRAQQLGYWLGRWRLLLSLVLRRQPCSRRRQRTRGRQRGVRGRSAVRQLRHGVSVRPARLDDEHRLHGLVHGVVRQIASRRAPTVRSRR